MEGEMNMQRYGPTGALNEYAWEGGISHGVHYGDFHGDSQVLFDLIAKEEAFLLKSPQKRRILFDLYHTDLTDEVLEHLMIHLSHIAPRIIKVAFAAEGKELRKLKRAIKKSQPIPLSYCMFGEDQNTNKSWLVNDR